MTDQVAEKVVADEGDRVVLSHRGKIWSAVAVALCVAGCLAGTLIVGALGIAVGVALGNWWVVIGVVVLMAVVLLRAR